MTYRIRALSHGVTLAAGLALGWTLSHGQAPRLQAAPGGAGEDQVAAGPTTIEYDQGNRIQVERDAIYYLDYRAGRLLAAVPSYQQTVGATQLLGAFAERDLVADFKLKPGSTAPQFRIVTGTLGNVNGAWAPLYVFEGSSRQVATYRAFSQSFGRNNQPRFELLELRSFAPAKAATAPRPQ